MDLEIKENTGLSGIYLHDFKVSKNSFDRNPKALTLREKSVYIYTHIYIYDFIKIKTLRKWINKPYSGINIYIQRTYTQTI